MRWQIGLGIALLALFFVSCSKENEEEGSQKKNEASSTSTTPDTTSKIDSTADAGDPDASGPSAERLALGKKAWEIGRCAQCHGDNAKGGRLGPDLTDSTWLHGDGSVDAIHKVLVSGVSRDEFKGTGWMLPMNSATFLVKDDDQLTALAQYVWSLSH